MQRHIRLPLVDGRVLLVGIHDLELRDAHSRKAGSLTLAQAREMLEAEPEPQRTSNLDVLARHHDPARPPREPD